MLCVVPNCNKNLGVPFPKGEEGRLLINKLKISSQIPSDGIICYGHLRLKNLRSAKGLGVSSSTTGGNKESASIIRIIKAPKHGYMCRICMSSKNLVKKISDHIEGGVPIMSIVMLTCYPIKLTLNDNLPKDICRTCLNDLKIAHKLRLRCLDSAKQIPMRMEATQAHKRKLSEQQKNILNVHKRGKISNVVEETIENIIKEVEGQGPDSDEMEINEAKLKIMDALTQGPNCLKSDSNNQVSFTNSVPTNDQLLDTLSEEIKPDSKKPAIIGKDVVLPKSIKLTAMHKYRSEVGRFNCTLVYGIQDSIFVKAEDYMYTYGLQKHEYRNLHCIISVCKSLAVQRSVAKNHYEDTIVVEEPHNHPPPSESEQKKQMFYSVMRKRMQNDRSLNIRSLYEEFCQMEPTLRDGVPLRNVISEVCKHQLYTRKPDVTSFEVFYDEIETCFTKLHFTISGQQFFQEKFVTEDGGLAVVFCNVDVAEQLADSKIMYVDASFKIETSEDFKYQLVTVLVWVEESYYPILFALVNKRSRLIYKRVFQHLHDHLAPNLKPEEIVTDYEANLYYALGETYLHSHIGGSVFYYTQNLYKKVCSLNLSRDLETNSYFRGLYHMLLMLPLLPVNTILDGLNNIEVQARESGLTDLAKPLFEHVRKQWIANVTPELFCVHRLENRINENVIAPFKKMRDLLLVSKGKLSRNSINIIQVVQKLIDLESFLSDTYSKQDKRSFGRDLSSSQKKNVLRAWSYIETHPKININNFFTKVLGYIKCMENQLWIWGFYRFIGSSDDYLIDANNFSIVNAVDKSSELEETEMDPEECSNENNVVEFIEETKMEHRQCSNEENGVEFIQDFNIENEDLDYNCTTPINRDDKTNVLAVDMFLDDSIEQNQENGLQDISQVISQEVDDVIGHEVAEVIGHEVNNEENARILTSDALQAVFAEAVQDAVGDDEILDDTMCQSDDIIHETSEIIYEHHDLDETIISEETGMRNCVDIIENSCGSDEIMGEVINTLEENIVRSPSSERPIMIMEAVLDEKGEMVITTHKQGSDGYINSLQGFV